MALSSKDAEKAPYPCPTKPVSCLVYSFPDGKHVILSSVCCKINGMELSALRKTLAMLCVFALLLGVVTPTSSAIAMQAPLLPQDSRAARVLSLVTPMRITESGRLEYFDQGLKGFTPAALMESHRHQIYPYTPVKRVDFFIIHYDAFPNLKADGKPGTVQSTVANLNDIRMASVNYCVDSYPITHNISEKQGMGVIMATLPANPPFKARHTAISISLEKGLDLNSQKTADLMAQLGISTRLTAFNEDKTKDLDSVSLGVEQSGNDFSKVFPANMPPDREIANLLSLTAAVARQYDLKIWDILGHNEVQQKPDPGNEYMTILRFLLAQLYLQQEDLFPENFLGDEPATFFARLKDYAISLIGEQGYQRSLNWLGAEEAIPSAPRMSSLKICKNRKPSLFELY